MPRRKKASGREGLKHKYKVQKKVREHHRQARREARAAGAAGLRGGSSAASKARKDPGLPQLYPLREQFLARQQAQKDAQEERRLREQARQREERVAALRAARRAAAGNAELAASASASASGSVQVGVAPTGEPVLLTAEEAALLAAAEQHDEMAALLAGAEQGAAAWAAAGAGAGEEEESDPWSVAAASASASAAGGAGGNKAALYQLRDGSRKAYYREFKKIVERADVVLEVLDARDPLGCRCVGVEERILREDPNKRIVLVLNKIDLVPRENVEAWLRYLRNEYPTYAVKCATSQSGSGHAGSTGGGRGRAVNASASSATDHALSGRETVGADQLLGVLKNYCRTNRGVKKSITVGIIGYPNVGKSSLINSLKRARAAAVGSMPGQTKSVQTVSIDRNINLLDCPGIVFDAEQAADGSTSALQGGSNTENDIILRNCVRIEQVADPEGPVHTIVARCQHDALIEMYEIPRFNDAHEFLAHVARKRGKLRKGGVPDIAAAARSVLIDWNAGRIAFYTQPPELYIPSVDREAALAGPEAAAAAAAQVAAHTGAAIVSGYAQEFDIDAVADAAVLDAGAQTAGTVLAMPMASSGPAGADVGMYVDQDQQGVMVQQQQQQAVDPTGAAVRSTFDHAASNAVLDRRARKAQREAMERARAQEEDETPMGDGQANARARAQLRRQRRQEQRAAALAAEAEAAAGMADGGAGAAAAAAAAAASMAGGEAYDFAALSQGAGF